MTSHLEGRWDRWPVLRVLSRHSAVATFVAGFLFDFLTMQRIDAWTDLGIQVLYIVGLVALLVGQQRHEAGVWMPSGRAASWWNYNVEALHFLYGGLLSAYVVLYVRSSAGARPITFLVLLVAVMVLNELPVIRQAGHALRLGLFGFCVLSFLNYFIPILLGRIGTSVFLLALAIASGLVWLLTGRLAAPGPRRTADRLRLFAPPAAVFALVGALYGLGLVPPIPLSVQFQGIYHDVSREGATYTLVYTRPADWMTWRRDSRPFMRREGDRLHYFAQVFAPAGFSHTVVIRWDVFDQASRTWTTTDRIPLSVTGGRAEGFRGTAVKSNFGPGLWRVRAETEDGRAIATLSFRVEDDTGTGERPWIRLQAALPAPVDASIARPTCPSPSATAG